MSYDLVNLRSCGLKPDWRSSKCGSEAALTRSTAMLSSSSILRATCSPKGLQVASHTCRSSQEMRKMHG